MIIEEERRLLKRNNWIVTMAVVGGLVVATLFALWSSSQTEEPSDHLSEATVEPDATQLHPTVEPTPDTVSVGATYYVSALGSNGDGSSWENAWRAFDQIDWAAIEPGALILIDGGEVSMRYATPLLIGAGGTEAAPVTVQLASEAGRNGQAILDGGGGFLPECRNEKPEFVESTHSFGIDTQNHRWLVIDGTKWLGIVVRNFQSGVLVDRGSTNVELRYLELANNGFMREYVDNSYPLWEGGWGPDGFGVKLGGMNHRFSHLMIHDNGGDQIQSLWEYNRNGSQENNLGNFELTRSWLYNKRRHSGETIPTEQIAHDRLQNLSFNFCAHADGVQIHDGGVVQGITITESVIGPGQTNNLILGTRDRGKAVVDVHDLLLQDILFLKGADSAILAPTGTDPQNWTIDRVTVHCMDPYENRPCIKIKAGRHHTIRDSILYAAQEREPIYVELSDGGSVTLKGICSSPTESSALSEAILTELLFNNLPDSVSDYDYFSLEDYAVVDGSPCAGLGSRISSVDMLLQE